MNRRIVISGISLGLFLFSCFASVFSEEVSETKTISFTKNVVVKKYKIGEVQAEPYMVEEGDNLWEILINKYGINRRQFYFFCRMTKHLNPELKNAHKIVPHQVLLVPFKYITHFNIPQEGFRSVLLNLLSSQSSQISTEEYTFSEGEHLAQVLRDMYIIPDDLIFDRYLNLVKKLNPDLENIDLVKPDQKITLPSFSSYLLSPKAASEPEKILEEESFKGEAQTEEASAGEEVVVAEKEAAPVYLDPRFKTIARKTPSSDTLYMQSIASIADVLQGELNRSGEFNIPLMKEGQITIDTSNFPVLQLTDRKKVLLNYGGRLPIVLTELLQSELSDFEVVNVKEHENIESVLDKILKVAGYFSLDKSHNPFVIGDKIQFEITGDWVIYTDEFLKDVMVVNLIEKGSKPLDSDLKDYLYSYGVNLIDLYMLNEGEKEEIDFPQKTAVSTYRPEDVSVIDTTDYAILVDFLLTLLEQNYQNDFMVKLFRGKTEGFDVEVIADRYFEREGKGHIVSFHTIPEKLIEVIKQQGNQFLNLSLSFDDYSVVIRKVLDFLHVSYNSPRPSFSDASGGEKRVELIVPGTLIKRDNKTSILLTSLELDKEVCQWLMEKKVKVVRLGI